MATDERAGAEIIVGKEACDLFTAELIKELGFPSGVSPPRELEECGRVRSTGFVWWKCKAPYEHFNVGTNSKNSYAAKTTAYVEKGKMKKMSGCKSRTPLKLWVTVVEMYLDGNKITFKSSVGVTKSFPLISFMNEGEKKAYLLQN
ncbi:uncharacterized protein LOC122654832 [Telopea speciosissima]|uniref:uncharacterized protein LOC122654832 n=1 Tax=Telopea speciosissima TaxID=54955 RepID=UPI001CC5C7CE|nr:uncharacterized protein LOC122654832 [Telopea speciosissima]